MLKIFKDGKGHPILNIQNFNIVRDYEGALTLSFDIRTNDKVKEYLQEEAIIQYRDNFYKIKTINQRKAITSITATLDMSEWQSKMFIDYDKTYALFSEVMLEVAPKDWIIEGAGSVTGRRAIHIEGASAYEILMNCKSLYGIVYEYHIAEKRIKVIKPDVVQSRGLYITDELNLKDLEFKGSSSNLCTRLYARGKKTETKDEEGNTTSIEYVNFASINGGKIYVDNNDYSNNVIALYWQDDRYTDPQSLLDDAIDKLKSLASPERSYSCTLMDLSRTNDKYKMLDFKMYDKVTLMDNVSKTCLQHQIVQYTEYPDDPNKNEVVLSSVFKKITGTIDGIKQSVSDIDTELKRSENYINEIIRDVASNTARIKNTYTKGETDTQIESVVQQTADEINQSITDVKNTNEGIVKQTNELKMTVDSLTNQITTTGGNNLINDSLGVFGGSWVSENDKKYSLNTSIDVRKRNLTGIAILLNADTITQIIQLPDGEYTLSFSYCKHVSLASVKVIIDIEEFELRNLDYTQFKHTFSISSGSVQIKFVSDTKDSCTIVNLMLNQGSVASVWSLSQGESYSANFQISKDGATVSSNTSDVIFNMKNDIVGFKNKNTEEYITNFTDVGIDVKEITVTGKARILGLLFQEINNQIVVNKLGR